MPDTQANHPHRPFNPDEWHDDQGVLERKKAMQARAAEETAKVAHKGEVAAKKVEREAAKAEGGEG